jgi:hypothetical protein
MEMWLIGEWTKWKRFDKMTDTTRVSWHLGDSKDAFALHLLICRKNELLGQKVFVNPGRLIEIATSIKNGGGEAFYLPDPETIAGIFGQALEWLHDPSSRGMRQVFYRTEHD